MAVPVGTPIIHQTTGAVVSHVVSVEEIAEKNIIRVAGLIAVNPLETAVLYASPDGVMRITAAERDALLESVGGTAGMPTGNRRMTATGPPPDG